MTNVAKDGSIYKSWTALDDASSNRFVARSETPHKNDDVPVQARRSLNDSFGVASDSPVHSDVSHAGSPTVSVKGEATGFLQYIDEAELEQDASTSKEEMSGDPREARKGNFVDHTSFSEFLASRHTEEQLLFLHDLREWRAGPSGKLLRKMIMTYFNEDSLHELNLGAAEKHHVIQKVGKKMENVCLDVDLFDKAEIHVLNTLRADALPAYFASQFFDAHLTEKHVFPDDTFLYFVKAMDEEGELWDRLDDRKGVQMWMSPPKMPRFIACRSRMLTSAMPEALFDLLTDSRSRTSIDINMTDIRLVKRYSKEFSVYHCLTDLNVLGVCKRDLVHGRISKKVNDSCWCVIDQSVDFEDCPPAPKGYVRMNSTGGYSGWLIRVIDSGFTEVSFLFHTHLGGRILAPAMKKAAKHRMYRNLKAFVSAAEGVTESLSSESSQNAEISTSTTSTTSAISMRSSSSGSNPNADAAALAKEATDYGL